MSKLVNLYIKAKSDELKHTPCLDEFMMDMKAKEHIENNQLTGYVRFAMYIGSGKGRQHIQEQFSFKELHDIHTRYITRNK